MGTGSFQGAKSGRGVMLIPHPLLVPWSWKCRAIPLLPLWAVRPVQSLSACTRVHFTLLTSFILHPAAALRKTILYIMTHMLYSGDDSWTPIDSWSSFFWWRGPQPHRLANFKTHLNKLVLLLPKCNSVSKQMYRCTLLLLDFVHCRYKTESTIFRQSALFPSSSTKHQIYWTTYRLSSYSQSMGTTAKLTSASKLLRSEIFHRFSVAYLHLWVFQWYPVTKNSLI
jgi:hypothetical protein